MPIERGLILTCEKCGATLALSGEWLDSDKRATREAALHGWLYVPDEFYHFEGQCFCPEHQTESVVDAS